MTVFSTAFEDSDAFDQYIEAMGWPEKVFEDAEKGNEDAKQYIKAIFPLNSQAVFQEHRRGYLERQANAGMLLPLVYLATGLSDYGKDTFRNATQLKQWTEQLFDDHGDEPWVVDGDEEEDKSTKAHLALSLGWMLTGSTVGKHKLPEHMLDIPKGITYMELSHSLGDYRAVVSLTNHYWKSGDVDKCAMWAKIGADLGRGECAHILALHYGSNVDPRYSDIRMRKKWLKVALRLGWEKAQDDLDKMNHLKPKTVRDYPDVVDSPDQFPFCYFCKVQEPAEQAFKRCARCRVV